MNTWIVGNHPVGHLVSDFSLRKNPKNEDADKQVTKAVEMLGEKVFFMKARIMAGQADLARNQFGLKDFKWLAREEIEKQVEASYWHSIKNMLPAR